VTQPAVGEFHLLRSVACMGVVVIHVISMLLRAPGSTPEWSLQFLGGLQMLLMFSTPTFVFLSAAIVGYAYDGAPKGFLRKRVLFVAVPFISIGVAFALFNAVLAFRHHADPGFFWTHFLRDTTRNLTGGAHTWFILPIFQFYVLYALFGRWLGRASPRTVIGAAVLINVAYLGFFNFLATPRDWTTLIHRHSYSLVFPAWTAYFAVGFYVGRYYDQVLNGLRTIVPLVGITGVAAATFMIWMHSSGALSDVSSRRLDMIPYTVCVIGLFVYAGARLQRIPQVIVRVSQLSFGVYLVHPFVLVVRCCETPSEAVDQV
jgi:membrane-bound acyltransferase YfiQ involved in biofilm formation